MHFLKTILWVLLAVIVVMLAANNWYDVTLGLWGSLEMTIKLPFLLLIMVLLGFVPAWMTMRSRMWSLRRQYGLDRAKPVPPAPGTNPVTGEEIEER